MSTYRLVAVTLALAATTLALPACKREGKATGTTSATVQEAPPLSAADQEAAADDVLSDKLAHYIECINTVDPFVSESYQYYTKDLSAKGEINRVRTPNVRSTGARLEPCFKELEAAATAEPKRPDLEQRAVAYRAALEQLEPLLLEGNRYYSQGDFKDDDFAHGNELHPQILAGFDAVRAARRALRDAVDAQNDELMARSLARLEQREGKSLRYYTRRLMIEGEATLDVALDPAAEPAAVRDAIEAYKTLYAELLDRHAKHPEEVELGGGLVAFIADANVVLGAFKDVQRNAAAKIAGKPLDAEDVRRNQLLEAYNRLVDESNELEWKSAE
ncbi:MAG: DUF3829 domain-containing protein [Myxococcales bacterium]|nr:DUF3829 domain-containing protein [Myxococcales bacterium]